MNKKILLSVLLVGLCIPFFSGVKGVNASINQRGTTGDIDPTEKLTEGYFPTTELKINLANLTQGESYGLLIGANQNTSDQQWFNFTASRSNIEIKTTHFVDQSTSGVNISGIIVPNLNRLEIRLYGILNDVDITPILLDTFYIKINYFDEQLPEFALPTIIGALIIMGILAGIFLVVIKSLNN